jgi:hypothetical protein
VRLQVLVLVLVVLSWQHGHPPWASACQSVVGVGGSSACGTAPLLQHRVVDPAWMAIGKRFDQSAVVGQVKFSLTPFFLTQVKFENATPVPTTFNCSQHCDNM